MTARDKAHVVVELRRVARGLDALASDVAARRARALRVGFVRRAVAEACSILQELHDGVDLPFAPSRLPFSRYPNRRSGRRSQGGSRRR